MATKNHVRVMRPCKPEEFEDLLAFLDTAFDKKPSRWFALYLEHIFSATPESINRHWIVRDPQGIAGAIGVYPFTVQIGSAKLTVGGVGSVSVRPDMRGKGLMSTMLEETIERLDSEGHDISWLGGNRYRYGNYGWELGGRTGRFVVELRDVERYFPKIGPLTPSVPTAADIPDLAKQYRRLGGGVVRAPGVWPIYLRSQSYTWAMVRDKGACAYLVHYAGAPDSIVELCGPPDLIVALLLGHGRAIGKGWLNVRAPLFPSPVLERLFKICASFALEHGNQFRVVNTESCWRTLTPELAVRAAKLGIRGADRQLASVTSETQRRVLLQRALGFFERTPALPSRLAAFDWVRPIEWWMSPVDGV